MTTSNEDVSLDEIVARGLAAVETDELGEAEAALEQAQRVGGENHVLVLYLDGMIALARGDLGHAIGYLMQATDMNPDRPEIYLDCAEALLLAGEDLAEAESIVRAALALPKLTLRQAGEAHLTLAQIRLEGDDIDGAMAELDAVGAELRDHPAYMSTRAAALLADDRVDEALESIRRAVEHDPEDPDFQYQFALTARAAGKVDEARDAMVRVAELDQGEAPARPLEDAEVQDLRARLEDVLEDLPDPILRLVASVPVEVQACATLDQVRGGLDPRSIVAFVGRPELDDQPAQLERLVVMRDLLLDEVGDDDEIPRVLFYALMEELRIFFRYEDFAFATADS